MARIYRHRDWWHSPRTPLLRRTFRGCWNFNRHYTWRFA